MPELGTMIDFGLEEINWFLALLKSAHQNNFRKNVHL